MPTKIIIDGNQIEFHSPYYDKLLIGEFKRQIPSSDRRPVYQNGKFQYWAVASQYKVQLENICKFALGENPTVSTKTTVATVETKIFDIRYIGSPYRS